MPIIADPPRLPTFVPPEAPGLWDGAKMDRETFHHRYGQTPPGFRAELVEGQVRVWRPSDGTKAHGRTLSAASAWLAEYSFRTPDVRALTRVTVILGEGSEPEPDAVLRRQTAEEDAAEGDYVVGPPDLVVEVADTTCAHDFGPKRRDYERHGVSEYLIVDVSRERTCWYVRDASEIFVRQPPGDDGLLKSRVFPGLWLDPAGFFADDDDAVGDALDRGLASPEHAAFVAAQSPAAQSSPTRPPTAE